jgi:acetyl esterase/lipase
VDDDDAAGGPSRVPEFPALAGHTPSYELFSTGHFLTRRSHEVVLKPVPAPTKAARKQPTASPLQATVEQPRGGPALVISGEFDVLRDEGEAYAHKLIETGFRSTAVRFHGNIRDLVLLNAIAQPRPPAGRSPVGGDHLQRFFAG